MTMTNHKALDWTTISAPSLADFEGLAEVAYAGLPEEFRALIGDIQIRIADFPENDVIEDMELDESSTFSVFSRESASRMIRSPPKPAGCPI